MKPTEDLPPVVEEARAAYERLLKVLSRTRERIAEDLRTFSARYGETATEFQKGVLAGYDALIALVTDAMNKPTKGGRKLW